MSSLRNKIYEVARRVEDGIINGKPQVLADAMQSPFFDIDMPLLDGNSPLTLASAENRVGYVQNFLLNGADVNHQDDTGSTSLNYAAQSPRHPKLIKVLLEQPDIYNTVNGIRGIDLPDNRNITPLLKAISNNYLVGVKLLLDSGADVNRKGINGMTPIITAIALMAGKYPELIKLVLKYNPDITLRDDDGMNALDYAISYRKPEIIQLLENYSQ